MKGNSVSQSGKSLQRHCFCTAKAKEDCNIIEALQGEEWEERGVGGSSVMKMGVATQLASQAK